MPLRPELFRRLEQRFGDVAIAREDEDLECRITSEPGDFDDQGRLRKKLEILAPGEAYRINCPFCTDTRRRLWINHMWGFKDEENPGVSYMWLVNCFNASCTKAYHIRKQLYAMVFDDVGYGQRPAGDFIQKGVRRPTELVAVEPPGRIARVGYLPPEHPACRYLRERGYDPREVYARYWVGYCVEAPPAYPLVTNRLVIPIYMNKKLVGWQARLLGTPSSKHIPKYYNLPNMPKLQMVYNLDKAKDYPYVVITEGVTSAWRYGPQAVAILGKKLSTPQAQKILGTWSDRFIFCMLDGSARDENQAMCDLLSINHPRVACIDLPPDKDPGDCTRDYLRGAVAQVAASKGWMLQL